MLSFTIRSSVNNFWHMLWTQVKHDLLPTPERVDLSWRIALICALMVCVAMIYKIPFVSVSCFVIFFVMRSDSAESNVLATALIILASIVVFVLLAIIEITLPSPALRLALILITSYFLLFFGASTQLGPLGGIIALVITFVLSILNYVEVPEIAVRGTLYAWLMAATPMGIVLLTNWLWGRRPKKVLYLELFERLHLCQQVLLQQKGLNALRDLLALGMEAQQKRIVWLRVFRLVPKQQVRWAEHATLHAYRMMLAVLAWDREGWLTDPRAAQLNQQLAELCLHAAHAVHQGQPLAAQLIPSPQQLKAKLIEGGSQAGQPIDLEIPSLLLDEFYAVFSALSQQDNFSKLDAEKEPFAQPDIWSNAQYKHHAIKGTAAATICYMLYSIADWQGIHTAMITCYVAALGSTAETLHKLTLRIIGCLIGAALGMLTLLFLMVHITDIGSLMLLVFLVSWLGAWVFTGPERISYMGIQIAFAFYLVVLHSFGPSFDFDAAWDRIVGVLLGNVMMYVFFTRIWPVGQKPVAERNLDQAQEVLEQISVSCTHDMDQWVQQVARVELKLAAARTNMQMMIFELKNIRPSPQEKKDLERHLAQLRERLDEALIQPLQAQQRAAQHSI